MSASSTMFKNDKFKLRGARTSPPPLPPLQMFSCRCMCVFD